MDTFLYLIVIISGLLFIRSEFVFKYRINASKIIYEYTGELIDKKLYNMNINYYDEMMVTYYKHVFSFWRWGKYSAIKNQYIEVLKLYID